MAAVRGARSIDPKKDFAYTIKETSSWPDKKRVHTVLDNAAKQFPEWKKALFENNQTALMLMVAHENLHAIEWAKKQVGFFESSQYELKTDAVDDAGNSALSLAVQFEDVPQEEKQELNDPVKAKKRDIANLVKYLGFKSISRDHALIVAFKHRNIRFCQQLLEWKTSYILFAYSLTTNQLDTYLKYFVVKFNYKGQHQLSNEEQDRLFREFGEPHRGFPFQNGAKSFFNIKIGDILKEYLYVTGDMRLFRLLKNDNFLKELFYCNDDGAYIIDQYDRYDRNLSNFFTNLVERLIEIDNLEGVIQVLKDYLSQVQERYRLCDREGRNEPESLSIDTSHTITTSLLRKQKWKFLHDLLLGGVIFVDPKLLEQLTKLRETQENNRVEIPPDLSELIALAVALHDEYSYNKDVYQKVASIEAYFLSCIKREDFHFLRAMLKTDTTGISSFLVPDKGAPFGRKHLGYVAGKNTRRHTQRYYECLQQCCRHAFSLGLIDIVKLFISNNVLPINPRRDLLILALPELPPRADQNASQENYNRCLAYSNLILEIKNIEGILQNCLDQNLGPTQKEMAVKNREKTLAKTKRSFDQLPDADQQDILEYLQKSSLKDLTSTWHLRQQEHKDEGNAAALNPPLVAAAATTTAAAAANNALNRTQDAAKQLLAFYETHRGFFSGNPKLGETLVAYAMEQLNSKSSP